VVRGSALQALNGDAAWEKKIDELMRGGREHSSAVRDVDKPFAMPIEDISRFPAAHGGDRKIERGKVKVSEEVRSLVSARRRRRLSPASKCSRSC